MSEKEILTIEDYRKHINKRYWEFIDSKNNKEMKLISIEITNILNILNKESKNTTVEFLNVLLQKYIEMPGMKDEDTVLFLTHLDFFYNEMK